MKKIKLLMPILGISTIASTAIPLASCNNGISLTSISIKTEPTKEFEVGQTFSSAGLVVIAKYSDNSTKEVKSGSTGLSTNYDGKTFAETDIGTDKTVTISYNDNNVVKTTTYKINVIPAVTIVEFDNAYTERLLCLYSNKINFKASETYLFKIDLSKRLTIPLQDNFDMVFLMDMDESEQFSFEQYVDTRTIEINVDGVTLTSDQWTIYSDAKEANPGCLPCIQITDEDVINNYKDTTLITVKLTFKEDITTNASCGTL